MATIVKNNNKTKHLKNRKPLIEANQIRDPLDFRDGWWAGRISNGGGLSIKDQNPGNCGFESHRHQSLILYLVWTTFPYWLRWKLKSSGFFPATYTATYTLNCSIYFIHFCGRVPINIHWAVVRALSRHFGFPNVGWCPPSHADFLLFPDFFLS